MDQIQSALAILGAVVAALPILIAALQTLAGVLAKLALLTASPADDETVSKVSSALNVLASWVSKIEQFLPRPKTGKPNPVVEATLFAAAAQNESGGVK